MPHHPSRPARVTGPASCFELLEPRLLFTAIPSFVVAGTANDGLVELLDMRDNSILDLPATRIDAYRHGIVPYGPNFHGGVAVAVGDVNGDGTPDIVTAPASNGVPLVRVFNAVSGAQERNFYAFDPSFRGGLSVAVGDVNHDGKDDIIVAPNANAMPLVHVFDGATGRLSRAFYAYNPGFHGGVTLAAGDINGDGYADIITGTGYGGVPLVNVFDGASGHLARAFFAFDPSFRGGLSVASGDVNGDGKSDIVVGTGRGSAGDIRVFNGPDNAYKAGFVSGDTVGVNLATFDYDGDGKADIVVAHKITFYNRHILVYNGLSYRQIANWGNTSDDGPGIDGYNGDFLAAYTAP